MKKQTTTVKKAQLPHAVIREYEPDLSDEALENMVPPPKRRIGEDTPLVDVSQ